MRTPDSSCRRRRATDGTGVDGMKFIVAIVGGQPLNDAEFDTREEAAAEIDRLMEKPHLLPVRARSIYIKEVDE